MAQNLVADVRTLRELIQAKEGALLQLVESIPEARASSSTLGKRFLEEVLFVEPRHPSPEPPSGLSVHLNPERRHVRLGNHTICTVFDVHNATDRLVTLSTFSTPAPTRQSTAAFISAGEPTSLVLPPNSSCMLVVARPAHFSTKTHTLTVNCRVASELLNTLLAENATNAALLYSDRSKSFAFNFDVAEEELMAAERWTLDSFEVIEESEAQLLRALVYTSFNGGVPVETEVASITTERLHFHRAEFSDWRAVWAPAESIFADTCFIISRSPPGTRLFSSDPDQVSSLLAQLDGK